MNKHIRFFIAKYLLKNGYYVQNLPSCKFERKKIMSIFHRHKFKIFQDINRDIHILKCLDSTFLLKGDYAECGVYNGFSSHIINRWRNSENKYYLFDSFNGFDEQELEKEFEEFDLSNTFPKSNPSKSFVKKQIDKNFLKDSSIENVKKQLLIMKNCIFVKGFIPQTFSQIPENSKFKFVLIDLDISIPTTNSLVYFWPKMVKNGIIMIHDYNLRFPGIIQSVNKFANQHNIHIHKCIDHDSSVILIK